MSIEGLGFVGKACATAIHVKKHIEANGYSFEHYLNTTTEQFRALGVEGGPRMETAHVRPTSHSTPLVGTEQNSGRGIVA